jgi:hypothetical protein
MLTWLRTLTLIGLELLTTTIGITATLEVSWLHLAIIC